MNKKIPNFLIVGAAKSGSTSLYHYLNQHPEVYMPINKEPNFMVSDYQLKTSPECPSFKLDRKRMVFDDQEYFQLFEDCKDEHKAIGEATVTYLYKPEDAIPKIKKYLGDPKIIIILRNPVKRAFSQYSYVCELGMENEIFLDAIKKEPSRLRENWSSTFAYVDQGKFYAQVKSYMEAFSNVKLIILEEFVKDEQKYLKEIFQFLNIDDSFKNSFDEEHNVSGVPRFKFFHKLLVQDNPIKSIVKRLLSPIFSEDKLRSLGRNARTLNQGEKLELNSEDEGLLREEYKTDIMKLGQLTGLDLSIWTKQNEN